MRNLIQDSVWCPGPGDGPAFFSASGPVSYDDFSLNGYRTCSLTMPAEGRASNSYDLPVGLACAGLPGAGAICFGYYIRAVEADSIQLVGEFYAGDQLVRTLRADITRDVLYEFRQVMGRFPIPAGTDSARFSIRFAGKITACTFFAPMAYYC